MTIVPILLAVVACSPGKFNLDEKIGMCGDVSKSSFMKDCGQNYVETNVSGFLIPESSEEEFAANRAIAQTRALPVYSANGFFPGDLKLVGPDADIERAAKYSETAIRRASELGIK
ncbi:MAG: hypothetical protein KBS57_06810, partial [Alistipes sp.]|nr:hypothetical protein [Candidatus Minthomonas equi]